jgi:formylglycine-generating enzyme required for sulfatase activity
LTLRVTIREPLGERQLVQDELPISIGGAGSIVVVPVPGEGTVAWIGEHEGQLFVQSAHDAAPVLHNGALVSGSAWLRSGDVLDVGGGRLKIHSSPGGWLLEVVEGVAGNVTAPPVVEATSAIAGGGADDEALQPIAFRGSTTGGPAEKRPVPWWRIAIAAGIAVLAALAALVFTSTPVQVEIDPQPDLVAFEGGWPGLRLGSSFLLRPGRYELVAEHPGYEILRVPVEVTGDRDLRIVRRMAMLPGRLRIDLPVTGLVRIDGKEAGKAPGEFKLRAGKHTVLIDTERYVDYVADVQIEGLDKLQRLAPQLVPGWSVVTVASEPAGAELLVGGKPSGATPAKVELMAGNHRIELRRAGFKNWVSDVQVKANTPLTIGPVRLGIPDGRLLVRSRPVGASVTVGGTYRGRTPFEIEVRPDVPQVLAFTRDGYEGATREVTVASGASTVVEATLAPILGDVVVKATPADAQLLVDGTPRGVANQTLRLPATAHRIEIRKPGYVTYATIVTPRPNLAQNVEVTLLEGVTPTVASTTAAAASGAAAAGVAAAAAGGAPPEAVALRPAIQTKSGIELKVVPAGTFTMGSPRREAGRRANESQRPVELNRRFYMSLREITNAQFKQFRPEHRSGFIGQNTLELDRQPVVNVSWQDAAAFCNWLSSQEGLPAAYESKGGKLVAVQPMNNGYRLPTEAEWEWVARSSGGALRKYPWGDSLPVPPGAGNFADRKAQPLVPMVMAEYDDGAPATIAVGSFGPNALGFYDLGGNVAEWTHDIYTVQPPATATAVDPANSGEGVVHVIRGSSWKHSAVTELRLAYRDYGDGKRNDLGFRVARYAQ